MNAKQYAERLGIPHGTVKRWRHEGLPGRIKNRRVEIDIAAADTWVKEHHPRSIAFDRSSVIYVVSRGSDGAVKIGWTSDVERRVRELRKETHDTIAILAMLPGDKPNELRLHARFAAERIDGEWFRRSSAIDAFLDALREVAA